MSESSLKAGDEVVFSAKADGIVRKIIASEGPFEVTGEMEEPGLGPQVTLKDKPSGKVICGPQKNPRWISASYFQLPEPQEV